MKKFLFLIISVINIIFTAVYVALSPIEVVPSHYNVNGIADAYSSKWFVMFMPCILIVLGIIYLIYSFVAKRYENLLKNQKYVGKIVLILFLFFLILFWYLTVVTLSGTKKLSGSFEYLMLALLGGLVLFISNMFPKIKQNSTVGIRIPATLSSDTVWRKTHKLGGYLGVATGAILIIVAIAGMVFALNGMILLFSGVGLYMITGAIVPCVYACVLASKEKSYNIE